MNFLVLHAEKGEKGKNLTYVKQINPSNVEVAKDTVMTKMNWVLVSQFALINLVARVHMYISMVMIRPKLNVSIGKVNQNTNCFTPAEVPWKFNCSDYGHKLN